jgi:hypothetical protein
MMTGCPISCPAGLAHLHGRRHCGFYLPVWAAETADTQTGAVSRRLRLSYICSARDAWIPVEPAPDATDVDLGQALRRVIVRELARGT